jgi:hypothetical protein
MGVLMASAITTSVSAKVAKVDTVIESATAGNIKNITSEPTIKSIKSTDSGEIDITFDRVMDKETALDPLNYELNGKNLSSDLGLTSANNFYTDDNGCTIKITGLGSAIDTESNVLYIKNKVKDAYGNKVADDTRLEFDDLKAETKPTVLRVNVIDSQTIDIIFNKDVNHAYAENPANYKLLDSKNVDITDHIDKICNYKGEKDQSDTDVYKIKIKRVNPKDSTDDWRLNSSKYTLVVKNIIDTDSPANVMDELTTTLNVSDDAAPIGTGIFSNSSDKDKVIVYFNKAMDAATLTDKANYQFINGKGDTKPLPSDVTVTAGGDDKSALVEFPTSYCVKTSQARTGNENDVLSLIVSNVKDESGNLLKGVSYNNNYNIAEVKVGARVKANTLKTYYDGDDLKVDVQFDRSIDQINAADFTLGGVTPTSITHNGNIVTLKFRDGVAATTSDIKAAGTVTYANGKTNNNPTKIDLVKAEGQSAKLAISATGTTDETGALVSRNDNGSVATLSDTQAKVYYYQAGPRTTCFDNNDSNPDFWTATKDANGGKVYVTFDTPLDLNSGVKSNDITFTGLNGVDIKADNAAIDRIHPNTLVFNFNTKNKNYSAFTGSIDVRVKSSISLRTQKDVRGSNANYVPSSDDMKTRNITVTESNK